MRIGIGPVVRAPGRAAYGAPTWAASLLGVTLLMALGSAAWPQASPLVIGGAQFTPIEEVEEPEFDLVAQVDLSAAGPRDEAVFVFDVAEDGARHALHVSREKVFFTRTSATGSSEIGLSGVAPGLAKGPAAVCLARRAWKMAAVVGGRAVARAWDDLPFGGAVGYRVTAGTALISDVSYQPIGEITFEDNFMRTADTTGQWETVSGTWANEETIEIRGDARQAGQVDFKSVNAFSFRASGQEASVATTGYWFWDDYAYSASVKSDRGMMGIVFRYQDPANYLLLRVATDRGRAAGQPALQLLRILDGQPQELERANPTILSSQWYRLRVEVVDDGIWAYLDDQLMARAKDSTFAVGPIGLRADDTEGAFFDDVKVHPWSVLYDDFAASAPGRWEGVAGKWERQDAPRLRGGQLTKTADGRGLALAGRLDWSGYVFEAEAAAGADASVGLAFDARGPGDYYALRVGGGNSRGGYAGKAQLIKAAGGEVTVLAEGPATLPTDRPALLQVEADGPYLAGYLDGRRVVEAADQTITSGKVGLMADGPPGASFRNPYLRFIERRPPVVIPQTMVTDEEMKRDWASPAESWTPAEGQQTISWNKGGFFGESAVEIPLRAVRSASGQLTVLVSETEGQEAGAYGVTVATQQGTGALDVRISRDGQAIAGGSATLGEGEDDCTLRVELNGSYMMTFINDTCIASCRLEWRAAG